MSLLSLGSQKVSKPILRSPYFCVEGTYDWNPKAGIKCSIPKGSLSVPLKLDPSLISVNLNKENSVSTCLHCRKLALDSTLIVSSTVPSKRDKSSRCILGRKVIRAAVKASQFSTSKHLKTHASADRRHSSDSDMKGSAASIAACSSSVMSTVVRR